MNAERTTSKLSLTFAMRSVLAAELAEFFELELVGRLLLVLVGSVVFPLTLCAIEAYSNAHTLLQNSITQAKRAEMEVAFLLRPESAC
jgi:hypothetical protein